MRTKIEYHAALYSVRILRHMTHLKLFPSRCMTTPELQPRITSHLLLLRWESRNLHAKYLTLSKSEPRRMSQPLFVLPLRMSLHSHHPHPHRQCLRASKAGSPFLTNSRLLRPFSSCQRPLLLLSHTLQWLLHTLTGDHSFTLSPRNQPPSNKHLITITQTCYDASEIQVVAFFNREGYMYNSRRVILHTLFSTRSDTHYCMLQ